MPIDGMAAPAQLLMRWQLQSVPFVKQKHLEKKIMPEARFWTEREM
jgi:hypothetical protein